MKVRPTRLINDRYTVAMSRTLPLEGASTGEIEGVIFGRGLNCATESSVSRAETRTDPHPCDPIRLELAGEGSGGVELREIGPGDDLNVGDRVVSQDQNHVAPCSVDLLVPDLEIARLLDIDVDVGMTKPRIYLCESGWGGVAERFAHEGFATWTGSGRELVEVVAPDELVAKESL